MSLRARLGFTREPLYLMDGTAFVFRGFYAYQNMARSDGFPTNALFIVTRILLKLLREEKPRHFAFMMDGKKHNFRHEIFTEYKAQRSSTPDALVQQLEPIRRMLTSLGLPLIVSDECEADDCIASLTMRYREEMPVVIIGADKDLKQCLHPNVTLWDPASKDERITTLDSFREETGMEPTTWPDFQAVTGDSSDNIPGVPGIGVKTATELFRLFASLEEIEERFAAVPPKIRKKLEGQLENARLYRQLTSLRTDTCTDIDLARLAVQPVDLCAALGVMQEFELRTLMRELESMDRAGAMRCQAGSAPGEMLTGAIGKTADKAAATDAPVQASLLDEPVTLDLPLLAKPDDLPLTDPVYVVVPSPEKPEDLVVASASGEWLYRGDAEKLALRFGGEKSGLTLVVPDLKELYTLAACWKAVPVQNCFDLSIAAYLLNPEDRDYSWPKLAARWGEQVADKAVFASHPGALALQLHELFCQRLTATGADSLMREMEMPLIPVLRAMEEAGIRIDKEAFAAFLDEVQQEIDRLTADIFRHAGGPFNIRSSQQMAEVLFQTLGLPQARKTKGGAMSTSQEVLEKLAGQHDIVRAILDYRKLEKLRGTYLEPLPQLADSQDRVHTTFNMVATATGRLSSSNPNLQNIPVRGEFGNRMRSCFVAAPGKKLVSADYSQVELRILAHMSGDPVLIDSFQKNEDIHRRTAALLFECAPEMVTPDQRRGAKTINFGLVYGMGPQKLAQELGITMNEAKGFIERYFESLTALRDFYNQVEEDARNHGFVATLTGRRRYVPEITSSNQQMRSQARRQAINARVQGSAADVIKLAMCQAFHDPILRDCGARLLLQVHDELVMEAPAHCADAAGERLAAIMAGVRPGGVELSVPLVVEWGAGDNWDQAH